MNNWATMTRNTWQMPCRKIPDIIGQNWTAAAKIPSRAAHADGLAIYLEARAPGMAGPLAGLLLYRQGDRLSTAISGDDAAARATHPGVLHLLRWRAIQLAAREGRAEMDLGGVDVAGARHEPRPGEPMFGLYQHKQSFGARFVEQVGAHQRVLRPRHLALVRAAARVMGRGR